MLSPRHLLAAATALAALAASAPVAAAQTPPPWLELRTA